MLSFGESGQSSKPGMNFLNQIWGYEYDGETRTLDMHIRTLRQKLGEEGGSCIKTVRGVGYRLVRSETKEEDR